MENTIAVAGLSALAHETRLNIFRELVKAGPVGLPAGDIARKVDVAPTTLSFHLKEFQRSGLLTSRRESRQIFYAVDFVSMRQLLDFLMDDCCQGHPEICQVTDGTLNCAPGKKPNRVKSKVK